MKPKYRLLGLLVAVATGALAMSGSVGASSALAACAKGLAFEGQGSSLQGIAQTSVWISGSKCKDTYTASGSAAGLEAFGVGGAKKVNPADTYIGTDDAPNGSAITGQLLEMEEASEKAEPVVVPVAQAAIAIIVKPPTGCTVTKIENESLESVFSGLTLLWSQIKPMPSGGASCEVEITRVVRLDGSGTTYQFKHYLFENKTAALDCTGVTKRTWLQLQEETVPNTEWPETGLCNAGEGPVTPLLKSAVKGGKGEVEEVKKTASSIGYANLGDAREGYKDTVPAEKLEMYWLEVQNNVKKIPATYAPPGNKLNAMGVIEEPSLGAEEANCSETKYTNLAKVEKVEIDVDWSEVNAELAIIKTYPICTLTWDVAWELYVLGGIYGATAEELGEETKSYLEWVTGNGAGEGQLEISNKHDYQKLPAGLSKLAEELAKLVA
jgi:ABC-type phosphate transport system substrate-binding protein